MKVEIKTGKKYQAVIERGSLAHTGELVRSALPRAAKILVVADENTEKLYLSEALESLKKSGYNAISFVVKAGEQSKSLDSFGKILNFAASQNFTRDDAFAALGGGVVGDLTGFAAACFMRGTAYVQIATTLLAAIDSSVGGKTAVNLDGGKNMVGAFHQPSLVIIDPETLKTLPREEYLCGMGEAVKYAVLSGGEIYDLLLGGVDDGNIDGLIELCVRYKALVVESDERESGLRKTLNLGHTFGHAYERLSDFKLHHGIAVALGLKTAARIELRRGRLSESEFEKIEALIDKYGFKGFTDYPKSEIMRVVASDKKINSHGEISFVGIRGAGEVYLENVSLGELGEWL